ncbi:LapA family protein [Brachybacterium phenoliresistens]|uniref:LapA family protein n=1 Tax=Brachybacterium phenoliresistens TaxID=396014 RepID=UPI0031DCC0FB
MNQPTDPRNPLDPADASREDAAAHPISRSADSASIESTPADTAGPAAPRPEAAPRQEPAPRPRPELPPEDDARPGGLSVGLWISLILGAIVLILLLIFVIQNNVPAGFEYFGAQFSLPLGVAMLLAAIAGALVMALVGSVRIMQLSWTIRKMRKNEKRIRSAIER